MNQFDFIFTKYRIAFFFLFKKRPKSVVIILGFQARGAVIMFLSGFLTFMAIGGFPSFVEEMKVLKSGSMLLVVERNWQKLKI